MMCWLVPIRSIVRMAMRMPMIMGSTILVVAMVVTVFMGMN